MATAKTDELKHRYFKKLCIVYIHLLSKLILELAPGGNLRHFLQVCYKVGVWNDARFVVCDPFVIQVDNALDI